MYMKNTFIISFLVSLLVFTSTFVTTEIVLGDAPIEENTNILKVIHQSTEIMNEVIIS